MSRWSIKLFSTSVQYPYMNQLRDPPWNLLIFFFLFCFSVFYICVHLWGFGFLELFLLQFPTSPQICFEYCKLFVCLFILSFITNIDLPYFKWLQNQKHKTQATLPLITINKWSKFRNSVGWTDIIIRKSFSLFLVYYIKMGKDNVNLEAAFKGRMISAEFCRTMTTLLK